MGQHILRREAIRAGLAAMVGPVAIGMARPPTREVRAFRLVEAAGLRRFGYPVHTVVPNAVGGRHYRLVRDGRAIPAQFRESQGPGGRPEVELDFVASPGPLEAGRYEVQFGGEVESGPEPKEGLTLEERGGRFLVSQAGGTMTYEIDKDSPQFLRAVGSPRLGYLRDPGGALRFRKKGESESSVAWNGGKLGLSVIRHGPMAIGLRSGKSEVDPIGFGLELTIPSTKSWVEVVATAEDPSGIVEALEFDLNLLVEGTPTLVDFGAGSMVYGQIRGAERMELATTRSIVEGHPDSSPGWTVRKGTGGDPAIAAASAAGSPRPPEGWAHVMDARRCSALAIADFGRHRARDRIIVQADGRVRLARDFGGGEGGPARGPKSLAFWLHFVPMPVQVGAATSPQAILAPLLVEWDRSPTP